MKKILVLKIMLLVGAFAIAQKPKEVKIGDQVWMSVNLNVDKFLNGDSIPEARTPEEWIKAGEEGTPAWCYYNNDENNGKKYGKLYNQFAVNDTRGIAPKGWHIPTSKEFKILYFYLGGNEEMLTSDNSSKEITNKLQSALWIGNNKGNNSSHFNLLPSSFRSSEGEFGNENNCSILFKDFSYFRITGSGVTELRSMGDDLVDEFDGLSVRCVKD